MNDFCGNILFFSDLVLIRIFWLLKLFYISIILTVGVNRNDHSLKKWACQ